MQNSDCVVKMSEKKPNVQKLTGIERASLACFLVLFLASVGMTAYGFITQTDSLFWQFTLASLISMMAGYLYGSNRPK